MLCGKNSGIARKQTLRVTRKKCISQKLFRLLFIYRKWTWAMLIHGKDVSFDLNNRKVCDEKLPITSLTCLRFISAKFTHWAEYLEFENSPCFKRLPGANGRKKCLRIYRYKDRQEPRKQKTRTHKKLLTFVTQFNNNNNSNNNNNINNNNKHLYSAKSTNSS